MIVTDADSEIDGILVTTCDDPEVSALEHAEGAFHLDAADQSLIMAIKNGPQPYNTLADLNFDGALTQADLDAFSACSGTLGGRGVLTARNDIGYTGRDTIHPSGRRRL